MDFISFVKHRFIRMHRHNPLFAWGLSVVMVLLTLMLVLTIAPLILEFLAILTLILALITGIYWVATKTGFIDE